MAHRVPLINFVATAMESSDENLHACCKQLWPGMLKIALDVSEQIGGRRNHCAGYA